MRSLMLLAAFLPVLAFAGNVSELMSRAAAGKNPYMSIELKTEEIDTDNEVLAQQPATPQPLLEKENWLILQNVAAAKSNVAKNVAVLLDTADLERQALNGGDALKAKAKVQVLFPNPAFAQWGFVADGTCSVTPAGKNWSEPGFTIACTFPWPDLGKDGEYLQVLAFLGRK